MFMYKEWDPDKVSDAMREEAAALSEDPVTHAERLMLEHLPAAVLSVVHLSLYSENERIRLDASRELMARTLRPAQHIGESIGADDSIREALLLKISQVAQRIE